MAGSHGRGFHLNVDRITMIVDGGASNHLVDDELIPRRRNSMQDYKKLKEPQIIVTAGDKEVFATTTGTIWGYIIDQAGKRVPVRISAMIVSGLRRNLFSSIKARSSGVSTILKTGNPHIQFSSNNPLPLNHHPEDKGRCSFEVLLRALGDYSNDTPEKASQEDRASPPGVESTTDSSGVVSATLAGEPAAQIQDILYENADKLLKDNSRQNEMKTPNQELERHHHRLEHYHKELETHHQEPRLTFLPGTQLLRRPGLNLPL